MKFDKILVRPLGGQSPTPSHLFTFGIIALRVMHTKYGQNWQSTFRDFENVKSLRYWTWRKWKTMTEEVGLVKLTLAFWLTWASKIIIHKTLCMYPKNVTISMSFLLCGCYKPHQIQFSIDSFRLYNWQVSLFSIICVWFSQLIILYIILLKLCFFTLKNTKVKLARNSLLFSLVLKKSIMLWLAALLYRCYDLLIIATQQIKSHFQITWIITPSCSESPIILKIKRVV